RAMTRWAPYLIENGSNDLSDYFQTKRQIVYKTCDYNFPISIAFKTGHFPIKIYWDSTIFSENSCLTGSMIGFYPEFMCDVISPEDTFMGVEGYGEDGSSEVMIGQTIDTYYQLESVNTQSGEFYFLWITLADYFNLQNHLSPGCPGYVSTKNLSNNQYKPNTIFFSQGISDKSFVQLSRDN